LYFCVFVGGGENLLVPKFFVYIANFGILIKNEEKLFFGIFNEKK